MSEQMSEAEIKQYVQLAMEDLVTAEDNLRLGHLRAAVSRAYYDTMLCFMLSQPYWAAGAYGEANTRE